MQIEAFVICAGCLCLGVAALWMQYRFHADRSRRRHEYRLALVSAAASLATVERLASQEELEYLKSTVPVLNQIYHIVQYLRPQDRFGTVEYENPAERLRVKRVVGEDGTRGYGTRNHIR